jgi:hypothetical protein
VRLGSTKIRHGQFVRVQLAKAVLSYIICQNVGARGKLGFSTAVLTKGSPDRQAEVGDHSGHPHGVQVKSLKP